MVMQGREFCHPFVDVYGAEAGLVCYSTRIPLRLEMSQLSNRSLGRLDDVARLTFMAGGWPPLLNYYGLITCSTLFTLLNCHFTNAKLKSLVFQSGLVYVAAHTSL